MPPSLTTLVCFQLCSHKCLRLADHRLAQGIEREEVFSFPRSGAERSEEPVQQAQVLRHSQRGIHCPGRAKGFLGAVASDWNLE